MPSDAIFIRDRLTDQGEMEVYSALAKAARGDHQPTPLVYYGAAQALEGPPVEGVIVLRFEAMDAAMAWYDSPAYQEAKAHRLRGADYRVILADGCDCTVRLRLGRPGSRVGRRPA